MATTLQSSKTLILSLSLVSFVPSFSDVPLSLKLKAAPYKSLPGKRGSSLVLTSKLNTF